MDTRLHLEVGHVYLCSFVPILTGVGGGERKAGGGGVNRNGGRGGGAKCLSPYSASWNLCELLDRLLRQEQI